MNLHRGGKDESTFGPFLDVNHCRFENIGHGSRNKYKAAVQLYGVQDIQIKNSTFENCQPIKMHLVVGEPIVEVSHILLDNEKQIQVTGDQAYSIHTLFTPSAETKINRGTDSTPIGLIQSK